MNTNLIGHLAHMQTYPYIQFASESKRVFMLNHSCVEQFEQFDSNRIVKHLLNEFRLKASFKSIESTLYFFRNVKRSYAC